MEYERQGQLAIGLEPSLLDRNSLEQLHHKKHQPIVGHVVIEHPHRAAVLELVRHVAFAHEALLREFALVQLSVQHLDGTTHAVAMGGRVHR